MSVRAIGWAFAQEIGRSSAKYVLVALCDNASDTGLSFPCIKTICKKTELNRKTVLECLGWLEEKGWTVDTGRRTGRTGQVIIWQIQPNRERVPNLGLFGTNEGNSPVFSDETDPFFQPNRPKNGTRNHQEPSKEPSIPPKAPQGGISLKDLRSIKAGAPTNPLAIRIAGCIGRQDSTEWDKAEVKLFKQVAHRKDFQGELALVERYYKANRKKPDNVCRTSVERLLKYWTGEVDKARAWAEARTPRPPTLPRFMVDPEEKPQPLRKLTVGDISFIEEFERKNKRLPSGYVREGAEIKFMGESERG